MNLRLRKQTLNEISSSTASINFSKVKKPGAGSR